MSTRGWRQAPSVASQRPSFYRRTIPTYYNVVRHEFRKEFTDPNDHPATPFNKEYYFTPSDSKTLPDYLSVQEAALLFPELPIARSDDYEELNVLQTRTQKRDFVRTVSEYFTTVYNRKVVFLTRFYSAGEKVLGNIPILGTDGNPLTGSALDEAKLALYAGDFCQMYQEYQTAFTLTKYDPQIGMPTGLKGAKAWLRDKIDSDAENHVNWICCSANTLNPRAATDDQEFALKGIERYRQKANIEIEGASTVVEATNFRISAKATIENLTAVHAPAIVNSASQSLMGIGSRGELPLTYSAPSTGNWSYRFFAERRLANPDDGRVLMEPIESDIFSVSTSRARDVADNMIIDVGFKTNPPAAGKYSLGPITFRNANGPRAITIKVTVP